MGSSAGSAFFFATFLLGGDFFFGRAGANGLSSA
jgi:hypothetical protein